MSTVVLLKSESVDGPDKYVELLLSHNFKVSSITSLEFSSKNLDELKTMLHNPSIYAGMILTSPRAIISVEKAIAGDKVLPEWHILDNYIVGESSQSLAKSLLNLGTKGENSGNASNLADFILKDRQNKPKEKPFLFPCGNLKQNILQSKLSDFEIKVECIEVYETVPNPELAAILESTLKQKVDILIYFSPSGVKFTIDILRKNVSHLNDTKFVAIGPSTRKALEDHNIPVYRTCSKPSPESLLIALME